VIGGAAAPPPDSVNVRDYWCGHTGGPDTPLDAHQVRRISGLIDRLPSILPQVDPKRISLGGNSMGAHGGAKMLTRLSHKLAFAALDMPVWRRYGEHVMRAPVDGTVSVLTRPVGDVVASGTEVLRLVRGRPGHLVATVPEERARGLKPGLELTVRASRGLWSQKFKGTVVEVGPSVEQLPLRSWLSPQWPRWGRRAVIEVKDATAWQAGERLHVQF